MIELSVVEKKQLSDIEALINDIKCGINVNENIRLLSLRHKVTKKYLQDIMKSMLSKEDLEYITDLNNRVYALLEPVYDNLSKLALEHMHQWYKRVRRAAGELEPHLYQYQLDLAYWLLSAIIKDELPEALYTLLVSRGSGKNIALKW